MNDDNHFDWDSFEKNAIKRLMEGDELSGEDGILTPLIQRLLQASLDGEMQAHVNENRPNRRNGSKGKTVKSSQGLLRIDMPRDRDGSFNPGLLPKRSTTLGEGLDNKILALYGLGMSYSDIRTHLAEMYGVDVSQASLSAITDKILDELAGWQSRQLDPLYPFVWLDALHYKVRHEGRVITRAMYTVLALRLDGHKELLGLYISESEGARFWLGVLSDLQSRGVQDILVASVDGLKGFPEAIESIYPHTRVQLCLVHQMRNSLRFVPDRDRKGVARDLKKVYKGSSREDAKVAFEGFCAEWGKTYPMIVKSWTANWDRLMEMFEYPPDIRRIIYTTNPVEGVHRQLRKITKTKGAFVSDQALLKLLYLAYKNISGKWRITNQNWGLTLQQLYLLFPDRMPPIEKIADGG
jgi:transposase-like protein